VKKSLRLRSRSQGDCHHRRVPDVLRSEAGQGKVTIPTSDSGRVRTSVRDELLSGLWTQNQVSSVNRAARDLITPEHFQTLDAVLDKTPKALRIERSRGGRRISPRCSNAIHIWLNGLYQVKVSKRSRKNHAKLFSNFKSIGNNTLELRAPFPRELAVPLVRALLSSKATCVNTFGPFYLALRSGNHFLKRLVTFCESGGIRRQPKDDFSTLTASGQTS
jgi:hypothetical protein